MKKLIIFSSLLLGTLCFSQSVVEKYNSIYKRYEYFDSIGNLIGYKSYNNLSRQWEYFTVQPQNTKQPYKYRDPAKLDLGIDTYNQQSGGNNQNSNTRRNYYDESGNFVGVEIYNPRTKEWEYWEVKK